MGALLGQTNGMDQGAATVFSRSPFWRWVCRSRAKRFHATNTTLSSMCGVTGW